MILVAGATGQLGGLIAERLLEKGEKVRILVRPGSDYEHLVTAGAEPVIGDLKDPSSLATACRGVDSVVTTANSTARGGNDTVQSVDRVGNVNLIDAAAAAGVGHFIFVSLFGAQANHPIPLMAAKGETEDHLRASGMEWTVLQPNLFFDKLPMMVMAPAFTGQPVTLVGEGRRIHSLVAMRDVVEYAVAALEQEQSRGKTLVIGGPAPVSWRDVVAAFVAAFDRKIPIRTVPINEPIPGMPDFVYGLLAALEGYDSPLDSSNLADSYGVTPTTLAEFVHQTAANHHQQHDD